jgi:hypothetical protein
MWWGIAVIGGYLLWLMGDKAVDRAIASDLERRVEKFARGIAVAEGFFVQGSRPQRNHNPGNMILDLIGKAIGKDGPFVVYSNDADGWENLHKQVRLMLTNRSGIYRSSWTIAEVSMKYTQTEQAAWAANVARSCGCAVTTRISQIPV